MVPTWAFQGLINVTDGCLTSILPCVAHVGLGGNIGSAAARDYHAAIGESIIRYNGTLERYADDGVMVVFNDPVPVKNPALQAVLMALARRSRSLNGHLEPPRARDWLRHRDCARLRFARHHRVRGAFRLRRDRDCVQRRLSTVR